MPRTLAAAFSAALLFAASSIVIAAAQNSTPAPQQGQGQTAPRQRQPMPKPTNLQVLPKNIAVPDLLAMMRGFTGALGVECQFCHTTDPATHKPNFASDANADKAIARTMIAMTNEINAKYMSQVKDPDAT